ncbi:glycine oxidase [Arthrobacter sp. 1088]|uniref:glycine oxidase ThiO n=1 Tax=Arthrobacter sp. 1088 TaxID=2817768 RepID=UPI0028550A94|nr:glycine oxidase ThiO [Arthrobacter sp. 1088]MDR6686956.1 glycine oxidase [Arthrobacter sp. 1088]
MAESRQNPLQADVAVIGGGVIGLGIAHEVRRQGRSVVLIDPTPAVGATFAAAGMLAPVSELHYQEEDLLELMLESSQLWPAFVRSVHGSESAAGYRTTSTIAVGADAADRRALADLRTVQQAAGLRVEPLSLREAREREPLLSPGISCAFDIPADHQVDPRRLARCLLDGLSAHGPSDATWVSGAEDGFALPFQASRLLWDGERVCGVQLDSGAGRVVWASETVLACGLDAARIGGLPEGLNLPLRPVYGDILRLRVPQHLQPLLTSTIRGMVRGVPVYIVPRDDGTVVIGATQREDGLSASSNAVSAGGVYQLLRDAQVLVPAVAELELLEATARARPGTPDNAPLLGRVTGPGGTIDGLVIATGFFRHGVLLTPVAAKIVGGLISGPADPRWSIFRPDRFTATQDHLLQPAIKDTP